MSEGTVHPLAQPVGRTHAAGAFDWRAVLSADPRASAFALDTAPALPAAAEEFSGEACREIVEDLLDRTRTGAAVAEVHAPFCESKCDGCGCWQHAYKELESRRWADALVREMAAWADTHAQAGAPIQALRFGGGTPSALEPVDILHVLAKARQYLPLSNDCSIELQARVHGFSEEKIEAALFYRLPDKLSILSPYPIEVFYFSCAVPPSTSMHRFSFANIVCGKIAAASLSNTDSSS